MPDEPKNSGSGAKIVLGVLLVSFMSFVMMLGITASLLASVATPFLVIAKVQHWFTGKMSGVGSALEGFAGLFSSGDNKSIHDLLMANLDCSNVLPEDVKSGYCIQPVYAEQQSPVPEDKLWLLPVWQAAASKYKVPWELIAAVSAARSDFTNHDCPSSAEYPGNGAYRLSDYAWQKWGVEGEKTGHAALGSNEGAGKGCQSPQAPVSMKVDGKSDVQDAVDATFATAAALQDLGAADQWDYQEAVDESSGVCKTADGEGYIYRYSQGGGGNGGYNKNLQLSPSIVQLGLKYTYAEYGQKDFPESAGTIAGEDDPRQIPEGAVDEMISAVGQAMGIKPAILEQVRPGLHRTIKGESGFRPASMQGQISGDPNNAYPSRARGLFQFTPGTFWGSRVPGFDNIFNPLHNIIAAMNIMYHGEGGVYTFPPLRLGEDGVWPTGPGWSPHFRNNTNPYTSLDPGQPSDGSDTGGENQKTIALDPQTDPTSQAVGQMYGKNKQYSPCYVAVVHDWYQAIMLNPPIAGGAGGRLGLAIQIAQQQLAAGVKEDPAGCNCGPQVNQYLESVGINPFSGSADDRPWCAAFISWVLQKAQVAPVTLSTVNGGRGSAGAIDFWTFGATKNINMPPSYQPQPGDLVLFRVSADQSQAGHVGLVVSSGPQAFRTIEGNSGDAVSSHAYGRDAGSLSGAGISGFVALSAIYGDSLAEAPGDVLKPDITWKPIPFPDKRRTEMASYSQRHYGIDSWHLNNPKVVVEHFTDSTTLASAFNTFSQDIPDSELHELPGTCAHFIIDTDGTIYQLVSLNTTCRHTVGLNYNSIGVEMVGMSDSNILNNPAQLQASLKLSLWFMHHYGIKLGNIIGHNESLTSSYHRENVQSLKCQTHSDWNHADMNTYRKKLKALAKQNNVPLGDPVQPVSSGC